MKATEIQIGDRLYHKGQNNAFDLRVEQVTKRKIGYHAEPREHRMHYLRLDEVQPIPLTPELLELYGFKKSNFASIEGQHMWTWWKDTLTSVSLWCRELGDDTKDGWMVRVQSPISSICTRIDYVHELQHALPLCGISIDI